MLVIPLISVLAAVASVTNAAHDSLNNSHARRSMNKRQSQADRIRQRSEHAARQEGLDGLDPFNTASSSDSATSTSPLITLPGATSTDLSTTATSSTGSASASTTDSSSASSSTDSSSASATDSSSASATDSSSASATGSASASTDSASSTITSAPTSSASSTDSSSSSSSSTDTDTNPFSFLSSLLSSILATSSTDSSVFSSTAVFSASTTLTDSAPVSSSSSSATTSNPLSLSFSLSIPTSIPVSSSSASDTGSSGPVSSTITGNGTTSAPASSSSPSNVGQSVSQSQSQSNSAGSGPSSSVISTSSGVGFPVSSSVQSASSVSATGNSTSVSSVSQPTTTASVASDLTFILTESSLAIASMPTTSSLSLSNPDAPTTTVSFTASAQTALTTAALPSGLPSRIYPPSGVVNSPGGNYSFISLLFDGYLGWDFVCTSDVSSSQIFAFMPVILATALDTPTSEMETYALQVRIPDTYTNASDAQQLQTMYLAYIPSSLLDTLALQLKSRNSAFYTGLPDNNIATQLASHIVSAFALDSVADPNSSGSGGSSGGNSGSSEDLTSGSSESKTRQDAIIGVVSALGAIALIVLLFLAYRAFKRRAELAHHRLSDPPNMAGIRQPGHDFDQDSIGGQRRRSFYFAEDSLRGFAGSPQHGQQQQEEDMSYDHAARMPGQAGMTQRRNVMPAAISAPILQQSSMNW
ncbi:hypothetical protein HMN09_01060600 [Mycena chlorophos]|uniref:Mid2 domain-containing protein n=1 Tax=Mycena chlorophos TaxID=658473 RepID=A0A8H6VYJ4_MYCCL|nr:hypothetical protein HMN09_01060600 [Mycena chlorophos]